MTKDAEFTSIKHSKTELQRLNENRPQIKVHAITDDFNLSDSGLANVPDQAKETRTPAQPNTCTGQDEVGAKAKTEVSRQHPQVMRFCPSLSTDDLDISVSGKSFFESC